MPVTPAPRASTPFRFKAQVHLRELTGLKARNLRELLEQVRHVPGSVIYHHTHHFLQQHQYLNPEPPNDFAYWVREVLNETRLAEKLTAINTCEFSTIRALRDKIAETLEAFLKTSPRIAEAPPGEELHFIKSVSFIFPTPYEAYTLEEFSAVLSKVSIYSIYFHMFDARLRLEKPTNDFSLWLETELGETDLAKRISRMDPYTLTMEALRNRIILWVEQRLGKGTGEGHAAIKRL